jgi:hypothetical protein
MEENSAAMLARWLMEQRERPSPVQGVAPAGEPSPKNAYSASDNVFPDRSIPPPTNRRAA